MARYGHWFRPLTEAMREAGCIMVSQNSNHQKWRGVNPEQPLIVVSVKINDGKFAHKLAKQAGVTLRALFVAVSFVATARAEPPPNANPAFSSFYHSITTQDHTNSWCCSETTDCREVQTRKKGDTWFLFATKETFGRNWQKDNAWVEVPENAIAPNVREDVPRPAAAVACVYNGELRCFTPPMMGG